MIKNIFSDWKTTVTGIVTVIATYIDIVPNEVDSILAYIAGLLLIIAKDHNSKLKR